MLFYVIAEGKRQAKGEPHAASAITGCNGWTFMQSRIAPHKRTVLAPGLPNIKRLKFNKLHQ